MHAELLRSRSFLWSRTAALVSLAAVAAAFAQAPAAPANRSAAGEAAAKHAAGRAFQARALAFEPNCGQTDPRVQFLARVSHPAWFLPGVEAVLALGSVGSMESVGGASDTPHTLRLHLLGGNAQAQPTGGEAQPGKVHYFVGNDPAQWHRNI